MFLKLKFSRATSFGNIEAMIKMGISYLYNEGGRDVLMSILDTLDLGNS
jgi:hypothetical protein